MIGILLAAGFSRRFGRQNKLLQTLPDGRLMAIASAENLIQALHTSIVVVRPENQVLADAFKKAGLQVVFCRDEDQTMADSLTTAMRYSANIEAAKDGVVIALADMPYIAPATIHHVVKALEAGASIVMPSFQGQRGHPVGFAPKFYDALLALQGDEGARSIIKRHADEVLMLETHDAGILADIDTPADLVTKKSGI